MDMSLSKLLEMVKDREAWRVAVYESMSQRVGHDLATELNWRYLTDNLQCTTLQFAFLLNIIILSFSLLKYVYLVCSF